MKMLLVYAVLCLLVGYPQFIFILSFYERSGNDLLLLLKAEDKIILIHKV